MVPPVEMKKPRKLKALRYWHSVEEAAVREGVKKYGVKAWDVIKEEWAYAFAHRRSSKAIKTRYKMLMKQDKEKREKKEKEDEECRKKQEKEEEEDLLWFIKRGALKHNEDWRAAKADPTLLLDKLTIDEIKARYEQFKSAIPQNQLVKPSNETRYDELILLHHNYKRYTKFDSLSRAFYFEPEKSEWIPYEENIQAAFKINFKSKASGFEVFRNGSNAYISLHRMCEVELSSQKQHLVAWIDGHRVCTPKGVAFNGGDDFMRVLRPHPLVGNERFPVSYPLSWDDPDRELNNHTVMLIEKWEQSIVGVGIHLFDYASVSTLDRAQAFDSVSEDSGSYGWFSASKKDIRSILLNGFNSELFCLSAYTYPQMWNSLPPDDKGRRTLLLCKFKKGVITDKKQFKVRDENGSELNYPAEDHILPVAVFVFIEVDDYEGQERLVSVSKMADAFGKYVKCTKTTEMPLEVQPLAQDCRMYSSVRVLAGAMGRIQKDNRVLKFLGRLSLEGRFFA